LNGARKDQAEADDILSLRFLGTSNALKTLNKKLSIVLEIVVSEEAANLLAIWL
jgi:hypothetical protein